MNRKFIARQLILEAKRLLAAGKDESDYVYDPDHKHKPKGGHWEKTEKGWSQKKEKKDKGKKEEKTTNKPSRGVSDDFLSDRNLEDKIMNIDMTDEFANSLLDKAESLEVEHSYDNQQLKHNILKGIMYNEKTSAKVLRRAYEANPHKGEACYQVAHHPNTDGETLLKAFKNGYCSSQDKIDIVQHKNFPKEAIDLFVNGSKDQRRFIIYSGKLNDKQVMSLSKDNDKGVRTTVAFECKNKKVLEYLSDDKEQTVRSAVAQNENTQEEVLIKLSSDSSSYVRENVAANDNTPIEIVKKLQKDKNSSVKSAANRNLKRKQESY